MDALHIPDTATETYLERLAENITRQRERSDNKKVRAHLDLMLEKVYARLQEMRRESKKFPQKEEQDDLEVFELTDEFEEEKTEVTPENLAQEELEPEEAEQADVLLLTELIEEEGELAANEGDLSTQEHQVMKDRLRQVMQKVQERKQRSPEEDDGTVLADVMREISEEPPLDSADFSAEQEEKVKNRLKFILEAVQAKKQQPPESFVSAAFGQTLTRGYRGSVQPVEENLDGEQKEAQSDGASGVGISAEFHALSKDKQFVEICERISKGHSIDLLKEMPLSEREQDLLNALASHLNSYKGLKKQQVFEMQHLTARSIHELDLIFKTYRIQGYLKAELTNVYNRLLNIRGRFSMLLN
jgi:hypothetical protein